MWLVLRRKDMTEFEKFMAEWADKTGQEKRYRVMDSLTKLCVATYKTRRMAQNKADKLDLEYGAIRYYVTLF